MDDWFLQRGKAKLAVAEILGFLDRWIRRRLQDMSFVELWEVRRSFQRRVKELASLDSPHKNPSMGTRIRVDREHSFRRYIDQEDARRSDEQERLDPATYWGPLYGKLPNEDVAEFLTWKHKEHFWDTDYDKLIRAWRREIGRVLPVLSKSGSLPSNVHVRRPYHKEGSKRPPEVPKKTDPNEELPSDGGTEGIVFRPIADREIH